MNNLPVVLFPHTSLPERSLKQILGLCGPVTVCRPWYMNGPISGVETRGLPIRVVHPPAELRPSGDFHKLLGEYRNWIENRADRSYTALIRFTQGRDDNEETLWGIREAVRRAGKGGALEQEEWVTRSHLLLHFARELEEQQYDADSLLRSLKKNGHLLRDAVETDGESGSLLGDLPGFEQDPALDDSRLSCILAAWVSLFISLIGDRDPLITTNRRVMDHALDLSVKPAGERCSRLSSPFRFAFPDLSHHPVDRLEQIRNRILGIKEVGDLIGLLRGRPEEIDPQDLEDLMDRVQDVLPWDLSSGTLEFTVAHLPPDPEYVKNRRGAEAYPGARTLMFMEELRSNH